MSGLVGVVDDDNDVGEEDISTLGNVGGGDVDVDVDVDEEDIFILGNVGGGDIDEANLIFDTSESSDCENDNDLLNSPLSFISAASFLSFFLDIDRRELFRILCN
jgi:hypothetical protein